MAEGLAEPFERPKIQELTMDENEDYYEEIFERSFSRLLWTGIAVLVGIVVCVLMSSCRTVYVPVETVRTEVVEKHDSLVMRDSIYMRDSVFVMKSGDTITTYRTSIVYRDRWRDVVRVDSFVRVDSLQVPYPVERKLCFWEEVRLEATGAVVAMVAIGAMAIIWRVRRGRRRS